MKKQSFPNASDEIGTAQITDADLAAAPTAIDWSAKGATFRLRDIRHGGCQDCQILAALGDVAAAVPPIRLHAFALSKPSSPSSSLKKS